MDGLQYARISYITAFPQKTDKRMSCYDRYSSRIRQCDPLVSCIIKHTAKAVCFIMVEARGVEPLSENRFTELSTSVCYLLKFPLEHPITGAHPWVAFLCVTASKANRQCTCITK